MPGKISRMEAAASVLAGGGTLKAAIGAFAFPAIMTHSGRGSFLSIAPRNFPYEYTDPLTNSAVSQCLGWINRNFNQADFQVSRKRRDGQRVLVDNHPLVDLINRPNGFYSAAQLWAGTVTSFHIDGNAYWFIERNARGAGIPTRLWYVPHWMIEPKWPTDGSQFLTHYEYRVNGRMVEIPVSNIVHFRQGLDPGNTRKGLSPLRAALKEIFTDNEAAYFAAALLKNMAIPGVIVSPNEVTGMDATKARAIKETWRRKFGGDNRGEPLILDFQASIETIGFSPNDLNFEVLRRIPETRIAGAFGIPSVVVGLNVGNDSSTYNNLRELKKSAYEDNLVPTWYCFEEEITRQLLPQLSTRDDERAMFATDHIQALKESENDLHDRVRKDLEAGGIMLDEYRSAIGLPPLPDSAGQVLFLPGKSRPVTVQILADRAATPVEDNPAIGADGRMIESGEPKMLPPPVKKKSVEWNDLTLRREPSAIEQAVLDLKALSDTMTAGKARMQAVLTQARGRLIDQAAERLAGMDAGEYHALTLAADEVTAGAVTKAAQEIARQGAQLVAMELARQAGLKEGAGVDSVAELTAKVLLILSRLINEVQSRAVGLITSLALLTDDAEEIAGRVRAELAATSAGYVDRLAGEASNVALASGRASAYKARAEEIDRVIYSAILDDSTCESCEAADEKEGATPADIPGAPNPNCDGRASCRCVHVFVLKTESA